MYFIKILFVLTFLNGLRATAQELPVFLPKDGLVGWWPFTGNAKDSSGNFNNGTVLNATLTTDRFGTQNSAYNFNGNTSRIEVPDAAVLRCRMITMSAWVYSNLSVARQIIYKSDISSDYEAYSLNSGAFAGIKINSNCSAGLGWKIANFKAPVATASWEHLAATYDGNIIKLYRNGTLDTVVVSSGLIDSCVGGGVRFGFSHLRFSASTGDPFNGVIDDVGIWNRALTSTEIANLYNASLENTGNIGINTSNPQRSLHVKDVLRLEPRALAPPNPSQGDMYFDSNLKKLRVFDGSVWQNCW